MAKEKTPSYSISEDKLKAAKFAIEQIEKAHGKGSIMLLNQKQVQYDQKLFQLMINAEQSSAFTMI